MMPESNETSCAEHEANAQARRSVVGELKVLIDVLPATVRQSVISALRMALAELAL